MGFAKSGNKRRTRQPLIRRIDGVATFNHGKHAGETLEEVAEEDPGYLRWVWEKVSDDLPKEIVTELEETMEAYDVE